MLSPWQRQTLCNQFNIEENEEEKLKTILNRAPPKLIPNLQDKEKYVVHYRNLKYYLKMGLRLKKIHTAISFKQSPWLSTYIGKI
jgi:hypothetical protein